MSVEVLQTKEQNTLARSELKLRNLDCASSFLMRLLRKLNVVAGVSLGDYSKSWDVLKTLHFIENNVPSEGAILDMGAYGSEILCLLHRLKYTHLTGIDLNPDITKMPYQSSINYIQSDFMQTPFKNASFDVITAISVIEHGYDQGRLLKEISRLIKTGGYFIASVDYWPEKIDTSGTNVFGMDWKIFSRSELLSLITDAESYGFRPCGDISLESTDQVIRWQGKQYTFAWVALRKDR